MEGLMRPSCGGSGSEAGLRAWPSGEAGVASVSAPVFGEDRGSGRR